MTRLALSLALLLSAWPLPAAAQIARIAAPARSAPTVALPPFSVPLAPNTVLPPPVLPSFASPLFVPAVPAVLSAAAAKPVAAVARPVAAVAVPVSAQVPGEASSASAAQSFAQLTGETFVERARTEASPVPVLSAAGETPAPLPPSSGKPDPERAKSVRRMMIGTAVMKSGMETITLSVPLLAMTAFGGISAVAGLVVVYGLAQAAFAGMASGLSDRFSARKVLAGSVLVQSGLVAALLVVATTGALSAGTMIPIYLLIGGVSGVIETVRHSIPALVLGQDESALKKYNAKLHIAYETAGVVGALSAGALIGLVGPAWSLLIQPPAYALAAWYFWRVRHERPSGPAELAKTGRFGSVGAKVRAYFGDMKAGARIVLGDGRLRWVALAFVLPQIVHRVFENLLIPVFAKKVLEDPSASAWLLTASNAGELAGAALLLRLASRFKGSSAWVKWGAAGLLLIWSLAFSKSLPLLLPLILFSSLTWAASDLSLRSEVQRDVADKDQPRALSFLYGAFVVGSALASLALGAFLDALPLTQALVWVCAGFSALAAGVFVASRRLKG